MNIWQRSFFFKTLAVLFFFLFAFWTLYVLIDYASHTGTFHHQSHFNFKDLTLFYTGELIRRSEVLLPFAILIATIRVLTRLNVRNELVALLAAGISMKKLLRPFIWVGLCGVLFLYLNEEFLLPWSMQNARETLENKAADRSTHAEAAAAHQVQLEDGTFLIFQQYGRTENQFYDVWWVKSIDELWRLKVLGGAAPHTAIGGEVLKRDKRGALISVEKFKERDLPDIKFNQKRLLETLTPPEDLSISELAFKLMSHSEKEASSQKEARVETAFWRKMLLPWLALFAVIGPAPLAIVFSRRLNVFFIYTVSLFGLFFAYIVVNAASTLSERQVFSPMVAILLPFCLIASLLSLHWFKRA